MQRRHFLTSALVALSLGTAARAQMVDYTEGLAEAAMARGDRVVLVFAADWCGTCRRQEQILNELRAQNPAIDGELTLIRVDWDRHRGGDLVRRLAVPRRSTIIALRGETEIARLVAETGRPRIEALLQSALSA
jgi:thioredoxin 1